MTGLPRGALPSPLPVPTWAGPCVSDMTHHYLQWALPSREHLWKTRHWHCAVTSLEQDVSILSRQQCLSIKLGFSLTQDSWKSCGRTRMLSSLLGACREALSVGSKAGLLRAWPTPKPRSARGTFWT